MTQVTKRSVEAKGYTLTGPPLKFLLQASTYQLEEREIDDAPHSGPLGAIFRLQGLSNRTPSQVLDSWKNLTPTERDDIEKPSAQWISSVDKNQTALTDLDIVSFFIIFC